MDFRQPLFALSLSFAVTCSFAHAKNQEQLNNPILHSIYLDAGYSYSDSYLQDTLGGVDNIANVDENGWSANWGLSFNSAWSSNLHPYFDIHYIELDDRHFSLAGIGLQYDWREPNSRIFPYIALGAGYVWQQWDTAPLASADYARTITVVMPLPCKLDSIGC